MPHVLSESATACLEFTRVSSAFTEPKVAIACCTIAAPHSSGIPGSRAVYDSSDVADSGVGGPLEGGAERGVTAGQPVALLPYVPLQLTPDTCAVTVALHALLKVM